MFHLIRNGFATYVRMIGLHPMTQFQSTTPKSQLYLIVLNNKESNVSVARERSIGMNSLAAVVSVAKSFMVTVFSLSQKKRSIL